MMKMMSMAISAFLREGNSAINLCRKVSALVRKKPVHMQRIDDCGIDEHVMTPLSVYRWSVDFRTKEELMQFDAAIDGIVRVPSRLMTLDGSRRHTIRFYGVERE